MRAFITVAGDFPESLDLEELAKDSVDGDGPVLVGMELADLKDLLESAEDFAVISVELVD